MTHEEICTYEVSKLAKEKGFDVPTFGYYRIDTEDWYRTDVYEDWNDSTIRYSAPTQSLLQRWLREERKIIVEVSAFPNEKKEFVFDWVVLWNPLYIADSDAYSNGENYPTYELALEDALAYSLKNLV